MSDTFANNVATTDRVLAAQIRQVFNDQIIANINPSDIGAAAIGEASGATTEQVLYVYRSGSGQSLAPGNSNNNLIYNTVSADPLSSYNSTTGIYTIQEDGNYIVNVSLVVDGGSPGAIHDVKLAESGSTIVSLNGSGTYADASGTARFAGLSIAYLTEGQEVNIVVYYAGGGSPAQNAGGSSFNSWKLFKLP